MVVVVECYQPMEVQFPFASDGDLVLDDSPENRSERIDEPKSIPGFGSARGVAQTDLSAYNLVRMNNLMAAKA